MTEQPTGWLFPAGNGEDLVLTESESERLPRVDPGWERHRDTLGAARSGTDRPDSGGYYPTMTKYGELLTD